MKQVALDSFLEKYRDLSRTTATAKMELLVTLISSFQSLTNFTNNYNIDVIGVLNMPLEYYKTFSYVCRFSEKSAIYFK